MTNHDRDPAHSPGDDGHDTREPTAGPANTPPFEASDQPSESGEGRPPSHREHLGETHPSEERIEASAPAGPRGAGAPATPKGEGMEEDGVPGTPFCQDETSPPPAGDSLGIQPQRPLFPEKQAWRTPLQRVEPPIMDMNYPFVVRAYVRVA
jgi:hypothetical protein